MSARGEDSIEEKYDEDEHDEDDGSNNTNSMVAVDKDGAAMYYNSSSDKSPTVRRHTKFLDLTNGEGGEKRPNTATVVSATTYTYDDDDEMMDSPPDGGGVDMGEESHRHHPRSLLHGVNPNTPGKVVESGQEHTGRWTKEEHEAFLSALQMYGKEWKKVAAKVKTRTVVQTRTHAQKYFQKLQKAMEQSGGKEEITHVEMGVAPEAKKVASIKKKRVPGAGPVMPAPSIAANPSIAAKPRNTSVTSAAHLISSLSSQSIPPTTQSSSASFTSPASTSPGPPVLSRPQPPAPQQQQHQHQHQHQQTTYPPPRHGFSTTSETFRPSTTTSSAAPSSSSPYSNNYIPSATARKTTDWGGSGSSHPAAMKIVAPDPELTRGKFPEPSPAACGKRKLAEIAAARMLAGVAASGGGGGGGGSSGGKGGSFGGVGVGIGVGGSKPLLLSANEDIDGIATPPPSSPPHNTHVKVKEIPAPPLVGSGTMGPLRVGRVGVGGSSTGQENKPLLIVNPDSLGINYQEQKRRRGGESPVTPWDGQLEALVSESKNKTTDENEGISLSLELNPIGNGSSYDERYPHAICGPASAFGRTPLHKAVCDMDTGTLQRELNVVANNSEVVLSRRDEAGFCPLHSACALLMMHRHQQMKMTSGSIPPLEESSEIVKKLIAAGADPSCKDENGNTPLHWAARAGDKHVAEILLLKNCPQDAKNDRGETPLHWAMRAGRVGAEVVTVLLENGARPSVLDNDFKRPIDVAAESFHDDGTKQKSSDTTIAKPLSVSLTKRYPVIEKRKRLTREQKKAILEAAEERREIRSNFLKRSPQSRSLVLHHPECLEHIPKSASDWETPDRVTSIMRRINPPPPPPLPLSADPSEKSKGENSASRSNATTLPESSGIFPYEVTISKEFERAKLEILRRVHSTEYLAFVNELSKDLERQQKEAAGRVNGDGDGSDDGNNGEDGEEKKSGLPGTAPPVVPFTPMVQRTMIKIDESKVKRGNHSDTSFSVGSLKAARRAAGAVQHAVDCVLVGRNRNAFCVVRPPGHHAGINGLLDGGESCGFCIFNNVTAGALHAISDERLLCDRCAIVDIDVHHGNGTEEIVKRCNDPGKLFFFSIHLYDNDTSKKKRPNSFHYKFYPGTGSEDDVALNIINVPIVPLWREEDKLVNAPLKNTHNTRQRTKQQNKAATADSSEKEKQKNKSGSEDVTMDESSDMGPVRSTSPKQESLSSKVSDSESTTTTEDHKRLSSATSPKSHNAVVSSMSGRIAYRQAIQNRLLPALRAFNPDLILISAGFDAAKGDVGNARHERDRERMGLDLEPDDYAWTTRRILEIADICCQGRVVSVLEGGYGRTPLTSKTSTASSASNNRTEPAIKPLDRTIFAECAIRHLHAMVDPYDAECRFS